MSDSDFAAGKSRPAPDLVPFEGEYQEWCRAQFAAAHHDIWWVKGAQLTAGNLTLLLLAGIVASTKLLWPDSGARTLPFEARLGYSAIAGLVVLLGGLYAWDLFNTLVYARGRARQITKLVDDPQNVFEPNDRDPWRHWPIPVAITTIYTAAWTVTLIYFWVWSTLLALPPVAMTLGLIWWGTREMQEERANETQSRG